MSTSNNKYCGNLRKQNPAVKSPDAIKNPEPSRNTITQDQTAESDEKLAPFCELPRVAEGNELEKTELNPEVNADYVNELLRQLDA